MTNSKPGSTESNDTAEAFKEIHPESLNDSGPGSVPIEPTPKAILGEFSDPKPGLKPVHLCCQPEFAWLDTAFEMWASGEGTGWSLRRIAAYAHEKGFEICRDTIHRHLQQHRPELYAKIKEIKRITPLIDDEEEDG